MAPKRGLLHGAALISESARMSMAERRRLYAPAAGASPVVAASSAPATPASLVPSAAADAVVPCVRRRDTPAVNITRRGGAEVAVRGLASDGLDALVAQLSEERYARSSTAPRLSLLRTWSRFHQAAFGVRPDSLPVYPITTRSRVSVAALL